MDLTTSVTSSSAVGPSAKSCWARSLSLNMLAPIVSQRPVVCHSSAGWRIGMSSSCAPARFISSRTIASTLRSARMPRGRNVNSPAAVFLTIAARTSSLCESISASPGSSRRVWIIIFDHFIFYSSFSLLSKWRTPCVPAPCVRLRTRVRRACRRSRCRT